MKQKTQKNKKSEIDKAPVIQAMAAISSVNERRIEKMNKEKTVERKNQKNLKERGITLVALVITIIIIIILATVTINFAFGNNGLINRAQDASGIYANDTKYTEESITNMVSYINDILIGVGTGEETVKIEDVKGGEAFTTKTTVEDIEGNKVKVPAGFKIASNSGNTVQQGIVIEDVSASTDSTVQGSQFVWIPVGVFIKDGGTPSNEIVLGRYTFANDANGTPTLQQAAYTTENPENYITSKAIETCYEEISTYREGNTNMFGQNTTAYDLGAWVDSVKENGGYYIGRYEASFASGTSVDNYKAATKVSAIYPESTMSYAGGTLWVDITQPDASKVAINTYADSTSVKSDLMNSYAWDTAIVFIQECGHTDYANQHSKNTDLSNTGTNNDEVCGINDMASNLQEWTTEYSSFKNSIANCPGTGRGGWFGDEYYNSENYTAVRNYYMSGRNGLGFRLTLYMI